jgi:hypothetical protein
MKTTIKFSRWSEDERKALAIIIKRGKNKKVTVQNACAIAGKKLGRTPQACAYQWHHYIKGSLDIYLAPVVSTLEVQEVQAAETAVSDLEPVVDYVAKVEPTVEQKLPTIELHSTVNSEVCEVIAHADGTIIARANSRGLIIVIKQ